MSLFEYLEYPSDGIEHEERLLSEKSTASLRMTAFEHCQQSSRGGFQRNSCEIKTQTRNFLPCARPWVEIGSCPLPLVSPIATSLHDLSPKSLSRRGSTARAPEGLKRTIQSRGRLMEARSFSNSTLSFVSYTTSCSTSRPPFSKTSPMVSFARLPLKNITLSPFSHVVSIFSARTAALPVSSPSGDRPSNSCNGKNIG